MADTRNNIILIGMPGAGKSTLGVVMAKILNMDFLDCDLLIQKQAGTTLQHIIDERGTDGFIAVENRVLSGVRVENTIISTGGSAVYSSEAMAHLSETGRIVYLEISPEELKLRLGDLHERGVVMKDGIGGDLDKLFAEREPLYKQFADVTVDVNGLHITPAAKKVISTLRAAGAVPPVVAEREA